MSDGDIEPRRWLIAIVEDHLLQRMLTERIIEASPGMRVVYSGETLPAFVNWWEAQPAAARPDLLLLDLMVDHGSAASPAAVERLVSEGLLVGVFSALGSPSLVRQMIRSGATGVIGKRDSVEDILRAIRRILEGESWMTTEVASLIMNDPERPQLSDQEERTLVLYASGLTLDSVAAAIGVKSGTAQKYLQRVKAKYRAAHRPAGTKVELLQAALRDGLLTDRPSSDG